MSKRQNGKGEKAQIREIVVVEGRGDTVAVKNAVEADTIETSGFAISGKTWQLMEKAYERRGLILFLDPDYSGETIRRRLSRRFPLAKQAYLDRRCATRGEDVGIENGKPEEILRALEMSHEKIEEKKKKPEFTIDDLMENELIGSYAASSKREEVGGFLGIGGGNGKGFLRKLNQYRITKEEFHEALLSEKNQGNRE